MTCCNKKHLSSASNTLIHWDHIRSIFGQLLFGCWMKWGGWGDGGFQGENLPNSKAFFYQVLVHDQSFCLTRFEFWSIEFGWTFQSFAFVWQILFRFAWYHFSSRFHRSFLNLHIACSLFSCINLPVSNFKLCCVPWYSVCSFNPTFVVLHFGTIDTAFPQWHHSLWWLLGTFTRVKETPDTMTTNWKGTSSNSSILGISCQ